MRLRATARRLASKAATCVAVAMACGGPVDSNKGVLSAGGAGGMLNSGGVTATGGTSAGGVSSSNGGAGGVSAGGVGGSLGGYGGAASGFCPTLNLRFIDPTKYFFCIRQPSGCTTQPTSLPGCCLPTGVCGGLIEGVPDAAAGGIVPSDGCFSYAQISADPLFEDMPADPHQACTYPRTDAGIDASTADASTPSDARLPPDSSTRDSTGDQGG